MFTLLHLGSSKFISTACLVAVAASCDYSDDIGTDREEVESISRADIEAAVAALERGERTADTVGTEQDSPFNRLRQSPTGTIEAWRSFYVDSSGPGHFIQRGSLIALLDDLCIPQSTDIFVELAIGPLAAWTPSAGHHMVSDLERGRMTQAQAVRALGRISGTGCDGLVNPAKKQFNKGLSTLQGWVLDGSQPSQLRRLAGEALLTDHQEVAAQLRAQLPADEEWMLAPFEERRVELEVDDTPPPDNGLQATNITEGSASADDVVPSEQAMTVNTGPADIEHPEGDRVAYISAACNAEVTAGYDSNSDSLVSSWIVSARRSTSSVDSGLGADFADGEEKVRTEII